MVQPSPKHTRQVSESTGNQTDGNTGRKKLAGSVSRNHVGSRLPLPSRVRKAQKQLGRRIQALRKRKGVTPTQLGNACGLSTLKMGRIENGQVNLALSLIVRFANEFDTTVHHIFRGIR